MIPSITAILKNALSSHAQVCSRRQSIELELTAPDSHERIHPDGGDEESDTDHKGGDLGRYNVDCVNWLR
jgi:hypothetical protein